MLGKHVRVHLIFTVLFGGFGTAAFGATDAAPVPPPTVQIVVSVADQRLALIYDGGVVKKYPISTSKFGLGDRLGSYMTPLGQLRVCDKIGAGLVSGAVIKHRNATGEILPVNAAGRDPIVTRILWLEGLEPTNDNARARGIYIHGTVEESKVGEPVSYGCIRMKSSDVTELFAATPVGTPVEIVAGKLPRIRKPAAAKPEPVIVQKNPETRPLSLAVAPRPPEKPESRANIVLFGDRKPSAKAVTAAESPSVDSAPRPAKVSSRAVLLAEGREVTESGADDAAQRKIKVSMGRSILHAGLPDIAAAPADKQPARPPKPATRAR